MRRILILLVVVFGLSCGGREGVLPVEGSSVNSRLMGFSFEGEKGGHYTVEIAAGYYNAEDSFGQHIIVSIKSDSDKVVGEVPAWGSNYTWRVVYGDKHKGGLYHFSTVMNVRVDTAKTRLRIMQSAGAYKDDYVAVDGAGVLYDMQGRPVWCLPDGMGYGGNVTEMKFTSQGTITFMIEQTGYEVDMSGKILWQTPAHDSVCGNKGGDDYHHEFVRLLSGHYMILGTEYVWYKRAGAKDSSYWVADSGRHDKFAEVGAVKNRGKYGIVMELDEKGNVVWSWKSSVYLRTAEAASVWVGDSLLQDPHENAFYFDEQNKALYLSYRNLNSIVKIAYPSGKVLRVYKGVTKGNVLFCGQHGIVRSEDGYLYLFDNNTCGGGVGALPAVVMMRESGSDTVEKAWAYNCTADGYAGGFPYGGNGIALGNGDMFLCMGSDYPKVEIVNKEQQLLWRALPEKYDSTGKEWMPAKKIYRANIISRKDLERLIWHGDGRK